MVDVERGRTVEGWLPRRLGGGRGPGRQGGPTLPRARRVVFPTIQGRWLLGLGGVYVLLLEPDKYTSKLALKGLWSIDPLHTATNCHECTNLLLC